MPGPAASSTAGARSPATESALTGALEPVIGRRSPLGRAADAHAAIESRTTIGESLLVVG